MKRYTSKTGTTRVYWTTFPTVESIKKAVENTIDACRSAEVQPGLTYPLPTKEIFEAFLRAEHTEQENTSGNK
jgi:hypothetical protein